MLIGREGILGQGSGPFIGLPALAKRKKGLSVEPEYACIVLISGQQFLERAVITPLEQAAEENVPNPLVVVRVQPEHVTEMVDGAVDITEFQERARQAGPCPHVGPRFEKAPEVAGVLLEAMWPKRQLPGLHPLRIVVPSLLDQPRRLFGQENGNPTVSTVSR